MEGIISSADTVISIFDKMWTLISGNPYTATLLAASLLGVGIGVFGMIKAAAR